MFIGTKWNEGALRQEGNVYRPVGAMRPALRQEGHGILRLLVFPPNPNIIDYTRGTWVAEQPRGKRWHIHSHKSTFKRSLPSP